MLLKVFHFIGAIFRFIFGNILLLIHRYNKEKCAKKYFSNPLSVGWYWLFHDWIGCLISGSNSDVPWPVSSQNKVIGWKNIIFDPEDLHNFQGKGCYFQAAAQITIGKGTYIANNVGIITSNHDIVDVKKHSEAKPIYIGESSWIGMNSIILPNVELGPHTIVGAGSIVTHSFEEGYCVIAGNPARIIKKIGQKNRMEA